MKLCCTSNDCGSRKSRLPKLGLIELGPLSGRQNGPRVVHECSPRTKVHEGSPRTWGPRFVVSHIRVSIALNYYCDQ
jgi:hypothetical protein